MNSEEFRKKYIDEDGEVWGEGCALVDSDEVIDVKYVHYSYVYAVGDQFFCIEEIRTNSGYWADSEVIAVDVFEVQSYTKTITDWKRI